MIIKISITYLFLIFDSLLLFLFLLIDISLLPLILSSIFHLLLCLLRWSLGSLLSFSRFASWLLFGALSVHLRIRLLGIWLLGISFLFIGGGTLLIVLRQGWRWSNDVARLSTILRTISCSYRGCWKASLTNGRHCFYECFTKHLLHRHWFPALKFLHPTLFTLVKINVDEITEVLLKW